MLVLVAMVLDQSLRNTCNSMEASVFFSQALNIAVWRMITSHLVSYDEYYRARAPLPQPLAPAPRRESGRAQQVKTVKMF